MMNRWNGLCLGHLRPDPSREQSKLVFELTNILVGEAPPVFLALIDTLGVAT